MPFWKLPYLTSEIYYLTTANAKRVENHKQFSKNLSENIDLDKKVYWHEHSLGTVLSAQVIVHR